MRNIRTNHRILAASALGALLGILPGTTPSASAQTATFHFVDICRSDPSVNKDIVTVSLHDDFHNSLAGVTLNALWSYVDYRQNHAVFKYKQASCTTNRDGVCTFNGGSGRARWQLSEVVGYDMGSPAFDNEPTKLCPNTLMIDFW